MTPEELQTIVFSLRSDIGAVRDEMTALRRDIAPILKWKTGLASLFGILIAAGIVARAVDWIFQLFKDQMR